MKTRKTEKILEQGGSKDRITVELLELIPPETAHASLTYLCSVLLLHRSVNLKVKNLY